MTKFALIVITLSLFILAPEAEFVIKGKVKKRNTVIKINENFPPSCFYNNSIFKNNDTLKRVVFASKYIFTGKISSFQKKRRGNEKFKRNVFKVFVRRVLKGDIGALSDILNFETRTTNSSSRAYVFAEGGAVRKGCAGASNGWAALMFSREFSSPLKLLIDPVPTSLESVRRIKAVLRGKSITYSNAYISNITYYLTYLSCYVYLRSNTYLCRNASAIKKTRCSSTLH